MLFANLHDILIGMLHVFVGDRGCSLDPKEDSGSTRSGSPPNTWLVLFWLGESGFGILFLFLQGLFRLFRVSSVWSVNF
jgi:hypothetical protein